METLLVEVKDKEAADFIKRVLQEFQSVENVRIANKRPMTEEEEDEADLAAYHAAKAENEVGVPFEEVFAKWKEDGEI